MKLLAFFVLILSPIAEANNYISLDCTQSRVGGVKISFELNIDESNKTADLQSYKDGMSISRLTGLPVKIAPSSITISEIDGGDVSIHVIDRTTGRIDTDFTLRLSGGIQASNHFSGVCKKVTRNIKSLF